MQSVDVNVSILGDHFVGNDQRSSLVGGPEAIHAETEKVSKEASSKIRYSPARQASDAAEQRLEGFGQVMRDVVFVHLNHSPPTSFFVFQARLSADASNFGVIGTICDQTVERIFFDVGVWRPP